MVLRPKFREDMVKVVSTFLTDTFREAGRTTAVLGMSGGIDSSLVAKLCAEALGPRNVLGMSLQEAESADPTGKEDAEAWAKSLGIRFEAHDITPLVKAFDDHLSKMERKLLGNIKARIRMILLYHRANELKGMVVGTGNKSEVATSYFCYDAQTRVMTPDGPKYYWELLPGTPVFSLDFRTSQVVEAACEAVHVFDYQGDLVEIRAKRLDLLVTPNHRLVIVRNHGHGALGFVTAESRFMSGCTTLPTPTPWDGSVAPPPIIDTENFLGEDELAWNANAPVHMRTEDFLYLLGLFIGDGCVSIGRITLPFRGLTPMQRLAYRDEEDGRFAEIPSGPTLMKTYQAPRVFIGAGEGKRSRAPLLQVLARYGIHATQTPTVITFTNRALSAGFSECGSGARRKQIPPWVMKLPAEHLAHLYHGLMDSDGYASGGGYSTTSSKLAYQMVELCVKLGLHAWVKRLPARVTYYKGKLIQSNGAFDVRISPLARSLVFTRKNMRRTPYKGKVWCPSVPPHENLLIERNGRMSFCGNTKYGDGGVDLLPIGDLYKTQVREMAYYLGLPKRIIEKPPTAGLWKGQTDEGELGITYDDLDSILLGIELELDREEIAKEANVTLSEVERIRAMVAAGAHKRRTPLIPKLGVRTFGLDWREY